MLLTDRISDDVTNPLAMCLVPCAKFDSRVGIEENFINL